MKIIFIDLQLQRQSRWKDYVKIERDTFLEKHKGIWKKKHLYALF